MDLLVLESPRQTTIGGHAADAPGHLPFIHGSHPCSFGGVAHLSHFGAVSNPDIRGQPRSGRVSYDGGGVGSRPRGSVGIVSFPTPIDCR